MPERWLVITRHHLHGPMGLMGLSRSLRLRRGWSAGGCGHPLTPP
ncbi:MAG: hypothetical protein ACKOOH_10880 [Cyanobium sp.]